MNADTLVLDFIQDLDRAKSAESVSQRFQALIEAFGFTYFCIGALKPGRRERGIVWATSFNHPWFRYWVETDRIHIDPVIWRLKRKSDPVRWTSLGEQNPDVPNLDIMQDACAFGMHDGWSLAFRFGQKDIPAIAVGLGTPKFDLPAEHQIPLHLASVYCGTRLAEFARGAARCDALSLRERECLIWVASGKTDWDIAEILNISQQTVHKHVSNALKKLNAQTRAQAVAVALSNKQITL